MLRTGHRERGRIANCWNRSPGIAFGPWGVWEWWMRDAYRERAAECFRLANGLNDPQLRALLFEMARAWLRLSDQAEKNSQADLTYETPASVQQQQQQQQKRAEPKD
jgi:hypothetical protein